MSKLTAIRLRSQLVYDPETGIFRRRIDVSNVKAGSVAGTLVRGYRIIAIDGKRYPAHRLAWLYVTGDWPIGEVDHRDLDRDNNRWINLRDASRSQNQGNRKIRRGNLSGWKGVTWHRRDKRWRAQLGKRYLGGFTCPAAAHFKYLVEAAKHFGDFARAA